MGLNGWRVLRIWFTGCPPQGRNNGTDDSPRKWIGVKLKLGIGLWSGPRKMKLRCLIFIGGDLFPNEIDTFGGKEERMIP